MLLSPLSVSRPAMLGNDGRTWIRSDGQTIFPGNRGGGHFGRGANKSDPKGLDFATVQSVKVVLDRILDLKWNDWK